VLLITNLDVGRRTSDVGRRKKAPRSQFPIAPAQLRWAPADV